MLEELQTRNRHVGFKQSLKAVESGKAVKVFLAQNVDPQMKQIMERMCSEKQVPIESAPSMNELGRACGINIGAAAAVITSD